MTVSSEVSRNDRVGTGVLDTFIFEFEIYMKTDIKVWVDGVPKYVDTHFTVPVAGINNPAGGTIVFTFGNIPALNAEIAIILDLPLTQLTNYVEGDKFPAETHETALDRLVKLAQALSNKLKKVLSIPTYSLGTGELPTDLIANYFVQVNNLATGFELEAVVPGGTDLSPYAKIHWIDCTSINADVAAIGIITKVTLLVSNTQPLTASLTIPSNITLKILNGGSIVHVHPFTLTINGPFEAGLYQVFSGFDAGDVTFGAGVVKEVYPEWWGNNTIPGTTDMTVEIQNAIDSLTNGIISLQNTIYLISSTLDLKKDRVNLIGKGQQVTIIRFNPTIGDIAIHVEKSPPGTMIVQCKLAGFAFDGTGDTTHQKIGIQIVDADILILDNIAISNWTGATSIGIQFKGRDLHNIGNISIYADLPIDFQDNPNSYLDADHYHFHDCYLVSKPDNSQPVINIASGVNIFNLYFDGYQAWVFGSHGLYWVDTTTTMVSLNVNIKNVRWEQSTAGAGHYMVYISHNYNLENLLIENTFCGNGADIDNIYLRKVLFPTLKNVKYAGTGKALDVDSTVYPIEGINCFWQGGSTAITTGLRMIYGSPKYPNTAPLPYKFTYDTDTNADKSSFIDVSLSGITHSLADNGKQAIGPETYRGLLLITCSDNLSAIYVLTGINHTVAEISDPNDAYTTTEGTDGYSNIYWDAGNNQYELENKRGAPYTYTFLLIGNAN